MYTPARLKDAHHKSIKRIHSAEAKQQAKRGAAALTSLFVALEPR